MRHDQAVRINRLAEREKTANRRFAAAMEAGDTRRASRAARCISMLNSRLEAAIAGEVASYKAS